MISACKHQKYSLAYLINIFYNSQNHSPSGVFVWNYNSSVLEQIYTHPRESQIKIQTKTNLKGNITGVRFQV